ncbi:DNA repair and recombination protein RAD54B isoform X2 [Thamnophis elegans]|uniref:DNA repair and recombination protein RAD54B isoform X2 n=1 Tax=Thamnophis elegans TaxID=35005 RepID=UPI0013774D7A|nr:DNA repair and recombination protein RAD54B isoform X2 [Thamnophis elegans]
MRRSAAPSQLLGQSAKKPRFIPPGKILQKTFEYVDPEMKTDEVCERQLCRSTSVNICSTTSGFHSSVAVKSKEEELPCENKNTVIGHLKTGIKSLCRTTIDPAATEKAGAPEEPSCLTKYFSVVWCKASKKKHKKWEGDAVLIVKGKSVMLKDMEGKNIGRGTGYQFRVLDNLTEGQSLMIGNKEIEVMGVILEEDFKSGKCFLSGLEATEEICNSSVASARQFCSPFKNVPKANPKENWSNCKPRHDPLAPNSLVMPYPCPSHQRLFNKSHLPIVDVVVDPYITSHLRPHQREGILFLYECVMGMRMSNRFGAILADEMGLGKTLQCISLIWTLLRQGPYGCKPVIKRALIVTPGSLVKNWGKEFQKWLGNERIKVFLVDQDHKVEEFINSPLYSVLILNYEMFLRSVDQIQKTKFSLVICDEGHRLKNSSIKTTAALLSLSCERRIILTGTPVQNDLQEFYALIEYVNPGILGPLSAYKKVYEEPILRSREPSAAEEDIELGEKRAAELMHLTGLFILRRTQEVINKFLPPKRESILFCRPTVLQLALYRTLLSSQVVRSCLQGSLENSPHLICIGALKKLCNHPCLLLKAIQKKESESCDNQDQTNLYCGLRDAFSQESTQTNVSESDSGKLKVLTQMLAAIRERGSSESSKAGGVGLNLVGASHLILYDIDWNPATDIQAMARVWRDGQKHTVHIYRLLTTGTIEEKIYQRQISKQALSGAVVDFSKGSEHIRFSVEELRNLFTLHEDSNCVTHDLLECDCMGKKDNQGCPVIQDDQNSQSDVKAKKSLTMSQLMQWKHFCVDHKNLPDPFLDRIKDNLTFIFQNVTS